MFSRTRSCLGVLLEYLKNIVLGVRILTLLSFYFQSQKLKIGKAGPHCFLTFNFFSPISLYLFDDITFIQRFGCIKHQYRSLMQRKMKISTFPFVHYKMLVNVGQCNVHISRLTICCKLWSALTESWLHFLVLFLPGAIIRDTSK